MNSFSTMPLRFRVWDKELEDFIRYEDIYDSSYDQSKMELEAIDLAHYLYNTDEKLENIVISQDTGLKDDVGNELFTGDIVEDSYGVGVIEYEAPILQTRYNYKHTNRCISGKKIGNIWQNSELLEENNG